ncbi:MAG: class I SAM-dependent methyltransferase [Candidatus Micrarchaeota archaeon]
MHSFKELQIKKWDKEYSEKGSLWHGPAHLDFDLPENSRVLELGCGNGKTLSGILRTNCKVTAIDSSPKAVELCKEMAERLGRNDAEILVADVCDLPFPESSFDIVLSFHILEHLLSEDRAKAVFEIKRVLVPGGKVFVRVFSVGDMRFGKGKEIEKNTFQRGNKLAYHYFTEQELGNLFSNFKKKESKTIFREVHYEKKTFKRERIQALFERA